MWISTFKLSGAAALAGLVWIGCAAHAQKQQPPEQDRRTLDLIAAGDHWTDDEVAKIATALGANAYIVLNAWRGPVTVQHASSFMALGARYGEMYAPGQTLPPGLYWNFSKDPVFISLGPAEAREQPLVEIPGETMVVFGAVVGEPGGMPRGGLTNRTVEATCGAGYYACCQENQGGSTMKSKCVPNGTVENCTGGGPGATQCSLTVD